MPFNGTSSEEDPLFSFQEAVRPFEIRPDTVRPQRTRRSREPSYDPTQNIENKLADLEVRAGDKGQQRLKEKFIKDITDLSFKIIDKIGDDNKKIEASIIPVIGSMPISYEQTVFRNYLENKPRKSDFEKDIHITRIALAMAFQRNHIDVLKKIKTLAAFKDIDISYTSQRAIASDKKYTLAFNSRVSSGYSDNIIKLEGSNFSPYQALANRHYNDAGRFDDKPARIIFKDINVGTVYFFGTYFIVPRFAFHNINNEETIEILKYIVKEGKKIADKDTFKPIENIKITHEILSIKQQDLKNELSTYENRLEDTMSLITARQNDIENFVESIPKLEKSIELASETFKKAENDKGSTHLDTFIDNKDILLAEPQIRDILLRNDDLIILTNDIIIDATVETYDEDDQPEDVENIGTYNIGRFVIQFSNNYIAIHNITHPVRGYDHPHINDGDICWGSIEEEVDDLFRKKDYFSLIFLILRFLSSYNDTDRHINITSWPQVK